MNASADVLASDVAPRRARPLDDAARVRRGWRSTRQVLLLTADASAATVALDVARRLRGGRGALPTEVAQAASEIRVTYSTLSLAVLAGWLILLVWHGAFANGIRWSVWDQCSRIMRSSVALLAAIGVGSMFARLETSRGWVLITSAGLLGGTCLAHLTVTSLLRLLMRAGIQAERLVVLGDIASRRELVAHLRRTSRHVRVVAEIDSDGSLSVSDRSEVAAIARRLGATAVVATDHAITDGSTRELAAELASIDVVTVVAPATREVLGPSLHIQPIGDIFMLRVGTGQQPLVQRIVKSAFDRAVAASAIVVLSPVLAAIALVIRRDGGPALFRQQRIGRNGRPFTILKFRTMCRDAEECLHRDGLYETYVANGFKLPPEDDPRITKVGRFLRSSSLDELPQLFNVLHGTMSMVGPRPVVPDELASYGPLRRAYVGLRPGVTGYWQANGRSNIGFPERAVLDSYYYDHQSFRLDLRILARTFLAVVCRRGAH